MRKICVFVGSRANYSSIKSTMRAVKAHPDLKLQVVLGASTLLERYGRVADLIEADGFEPDYTFYNIVEGETPTTMAKSTGLGTIEMATVLRNLEPDFVVVVGDRFEMMAVTLAAAYMNIRIAHTMGGEVTGTIDESIRHAITKFAHVHFPANEEARERIVKMGEDPAFVFDTGCPRVDLVAEELEKDSRPVLARELDMHAGVGGIFSMDEPFLLVSQHPVTTEFGSNRWHIEQTLEALAELKMHTIMLWPNIDAGSDNLSKGIRTFREIYKPDWLHLFKNLPIHVYIHLMRTAGCLVGNSSSGIREGAYIGTPVVNIGTRQHKRMRGSNVLDVGYGAADILAGIRRQLEHGHHVSSHIYGDGQAGARMAEILAHTDPGIQKTIVY
jgi:UDP-hydrolysing UDP-N-acetyl-D-glucosamine 2-epimerase